MGKVHALSGWQQFTLSQVPTVLEVRAILHTQKARRPTRHPPAGLCSHARCCACSPCCQHSPIAHIASVAVWNAHGVASSSRVITALCVGEARVALLVVVDAPAGGKGGACCGSLPGAAVRSYKSASRSSQQTPRLAELLRGQRRSRNLAGGAAPVAVVFALGERVAAWLDPRALAASGDALGAGRHLADRAALVAVVGALGGRVAAWLGLRALLAGAGA